MALCVGRLSPYSEFGDVADDDPNATYRYLTEQLNKFDLAYLHMISPRVAGYLDVEVSDSTQDLGHFRKLFNGTFIAAGMVEATLVFTTQSELGELNCCSKALPLYM